MKNNIKGCIILLVAAILWGSTFVAQRNGALYVGPFTFTFFRSIIAVIILAFITYFTDRKYFKEEDNIIFVNSGSITLPKNNTPHSYLTIDEEYICLKDLSGDIIDKIKY